MIKIKIYGSKDRQFYFIITRGQVSCTSETYTRKSDAKRAATNLANAFVERGCEIIDLTKESA